jgi:hypothetical protein
MKKLINFLSITSIGLGILISSQGDVKKGMVKQSKAYKFKFEPNATVQKSLTQPSSPIVVPNNRNGSVFTLVDSSKNGYGMILSSTRPLAYVEDQGLFLVYRQWAGPDHNAGQIGGSFSEDGSAGNWTTYQNLNPEPMWNGLDQEGRYPSALGNGNHPFAFWNVYSAEGSGYGGRGYYTWDEFGWDGGSFSGSHDVDLSWNGTKDHWAGSPDYSYDVINGIHHFNVTYADWTREDRFLFHSEAYDNGLIIFSSEHLVLDVNNDFMVGYASQPLLDINDDGIGYCSVSAYFLGADVGASPYCNTHTIAFKMTEDYGATWTGDQENSGYFFIDDNVYQHMLTSGVFPSEWTDPDGCDFDGDGLPDSYEWTELFAAYDYDLRVDSDGNPHIIAGILPSTDEYVYPGIAESNGFYHFWIDKDHLSSPGIVNTPNGWNYSFVASTQESWMWQDDAGSSYWQITFPSLAINADNNDVMYVVASMVVPGEFELTDDGGTPDDPCDDLGSYPAWSEDVFVMKSIDGGETWWNRFNVSATPDTTDGENQPDERAAHAASEGATDDRVYVCYQMPDWLYGSTTGDPSGSDHRNRVYAGYVDLTTEPTGEETIDLTIGNQNGWNLVGLPVGVEDASYQTLFPNSVVNTLYAFGVGYETATELSLGAGYWLRFNDAGENVLSGDIVDNLSASLAEGWNLISGGSFTSGIDDPNGIVVPNTLYGFGVGYEGATELEPGSGYWLRTSAAGDVTFSSTGLARIRQFTDRMKDANSISFNGNALYFGVQVPEDEILSYSLPPKPQFEGAFDVRFSGDWKFAENSGVIELMNNTDMISVQYSIKDGSEWVLESASGTVTLNGNGEIQVVSSDSYSLHKGSVSRTPETFALHQGYPNPFNPETTIEYDVARAGDVSIVVFDMLGREVKILRSGYHAQKTHSVSWNGTDNNGKSVPSGVYIYRMNSNDFSQVQKVMLLK